MSASQLGTALRGYLNRSTPGYMIFFVTPFCPCRCKMCFNMDAILNAGHRKVLTYEEIVKITKQWSGLHQVNFSGGDPLVRKDFPEIVKALYDNSGTRFFTIPTSSAFPEKYAEQVRKCLEYCPDAWIRVNQSIDGIGEVHNEIRQRTGLFDSVIELNSRLFEMTKEYKNLSTSIATVYCKFNEDTAYELLEYAYANLKFTDMASLYVRGKTPDNTAKNVEAEGYAAYSKACMSKRLANTKRMSLSSRAFTAVNMTVQQYVARAAMTNDYIMPCQAGRRMVVLDDQGDVQPCEMLDFMIKEGTAQVSTASLGNLRDFDYSIRKMLATPLAKKVAKEIVDTKCRCTFECAMAVNTIYNFRAWPRAAWNFLRLAN